MHLRESVAAEELPIAAFGRFEAVDDFLNFAHSIIQCEAIISCVQLQLKSSTVM